MKEYDADKDGKLSLSELMRDQGDKDQDETFPDIDIVKKAFGAADKNADSFIDLAELPDFNTAFDKENGEEVAEENEAEAGEEGEEGEEGAEAAEGEDVAEGENV